MYLVLHLNCISSIKYFVIHDIFEKNIYWNSIGVSISCKI
jgi:hypothetical protein